MTALESPDALVGILIALALGAARAVPIVWLVPAFGGRDLPVALRLGLGLTLATLALPRLVAGVAAAGAPWGWGLDQLGPLGWILLVSREVLIGVTVGLVVSFAFRAAEAAGGLIDIVRGANLADVLAPTAGTRVSPVGALYLLATLLVFVEIGGLGRLAVALSRSYDAVPIAGVGLLPTASSGLAGAVRLIVTASARLVEAAVGLAAPVIVAMLLADVALGMVARLMPAMPIYFAAMPLRALLGTGVVLLGLGTLDAALVAGFPAWIRLADAAFALWGR